MKIPLPARWLWLVCLAATPAGAAPIFASGPSHVVTPNQVTIRWTTIGDGSTEVHYGRTSAATFAGYTNQSIHLAETGPGHSRTLSFLDPGVWFYRVRSVDSFGVGAVSSEQSFTVPVPDQNVTLTRNAFNGPVKALARVGTTLFVGGRFTNVAPVRGSGLFAKATDGAVFPDTPMVAGTVRCAVPDGAGGVFIGGDFEAVGGLPRRHLAHLLADQGVDPDWSADVDGPVYALAMKSTTLYVGGNFTSVKGAPRRNAAALDAASGALNTTWNPSPGGQVLAIAAGTSIYLGGTFTTVGPGAGALPFNRAAAVDPVTGIPTSWNPDVSGAVNALAVDSAAATSVVFLGGSFTSVGGEAHANLAAVDATFGDNKWTTVAAAGADNTVFALAYDSGTLYAGGAFTTLSGDIRKYAGAVSGSTGAATAWDPRTTEQVYALSATTNEVILGGNFRSADLAIKRVGAALVTGSNGQLSAAWDPDLAGGAVYAIARTADGAAFLGGSFTAVGGTPRNNLAAIDLASDTLTPWNPNANSWVNAIVPTSSGIYLGGNFTEVGGSVRNHFAAVSADGGVLPGTPSIRGGEVTAMAQLGSKLYLVGAFDGVGGSDVRSRAAAIDLNTNQPTAWAPALEADATSIAVDSLSIFIGGHFTSVGGIPYGHLVETNLTDGAPTGFSTGTDQPVMALLRRGPRLFLGGAFSTVRGNPHARFAEVNLTLGIPTTVNHGFDAEVLALEETGGKPMVVGGKFTQVGTDKRRGAAVIDPGTGVATDFSPELLGDVQAVLPLCPEGMLFVGGNLNAAGVDSAGAFAAFRPGTLCPPVVPDGGADGGTGSDGGTSSDGGVAPNIFTTPSPTAVCLEPYLYAEGEDGPQALPNGVVWSLEEAPEGVSLNPISGALEWTPTRRQVGTHHLAVKATDGNGSDVQQWNVTVTCAAPALELGGCGCSSGGAWGAASLCLFALTRRRRTRSARAW